MNARATISAGLLLLAINPAWSQDPVDYPDRGVLGIETVSLVPGLEDVAGAPRQPGAWVISPDVANPPRADASENSVLPLIMAGDLVIALDGAQVWSSEDLHLKMEERKPGEVVSVTLVRKSKERTVRVRLKAGPAAVYLPARACAVPTGGTIFAQNFAPVFFFGLQATAQGGADIAGACPAVIDACTPLTFVKQTKDRLVVKINTHNFEIGGDWTKHTHVRQHACRVEEQSLTAQNDARRDEKERAEAARAAAN